MLCLKKRRTYSFTQGACADLPRRSKDNRSYEDSRNMAITTLPRKARSREEAPSRMVLTVTEDTPADMLAGSMELLVQLPRDHHLHTQRVTVQRSTPMMDLLVQIATAHKLAASSYTLQAIGERGLVLHHQPNTPIGALDALQVKLLPKQGTIVPRKTKQANQPFETTFRLQVHLPRNQLYVSRVSPKMNLGEILDEVCREKNLDRNKYELRHPANLEETLDLSLSLQDYHLQEVTLYARQGRTLGAALSSQDIMALQRQEERRRQQAKQSVFGFMFKKSKENSLSTDSLGGRSASPARSDETGRSASPLQPPARPQRKRRPAPKPPVARQAVSLPEENGCCAKDKMVISHSRNSSDSSGYHEASVLSDNPDSAGRLPETLPRRNRAQGAKETPRKLAHTSRSSKSLGNLAAASGTLSHAVSNTSLSSAGLRKKRAAPPPPGPRPLSSAVSTQALERIIDSEESLTSDMDPSKPPSDIGAPSKASSDIVDRPKASSDIGAPTTDRNFAQTVPLSIAKASGHGIDGSDVAEATPRPERLIVTNSNPGVVSPVEDAQRVESARAKRVGEPAPVPKPRKTSTETASIPKPPKRRLGPCSVSARTAYKEPASLASASHASIAAETSPGDSMIEKPVSEDKWVNDEPSLNCDEQRSTEEIASQQRNKDIEQKEHNIASEAYSISEDSSVHITSTEQPRLSSDSRDDERHERNESCEFIKRSVSSDEKFSSELLRKSLLPSDVDLVHSSSACSVISTIPKCERLDVSAENRDFVGNNSRMDHAFDDSSALSMDASSRGRANSRDETDEVEDDARRIGEAIEKAKRKSKVFRSQSKSNDFETDTFRRQRRHLTSHAEDVISAINLNLSPDSLLSFEEFEEQRSKDGGNGGFLGSSGISDAEDGLSETDILLRKVSDTLSSSIPASSSPLPTLQVVYEQTSEKHHVESNVPVNTGKTNSKEPNKSDEITSGSGSVGKDNNHSAETTKRRENSIEEKPTVSNENILSSTPNATIAAQQDTSDYVSALGDDLSITDWEYQLPAPPSAFRDSDSSVYSAQEAADAFQQPTESVTKTDSTDGCAKFNKNLAKEVALRVEEESSTNSEKVSSRKLEDLCNAKQVSNSNDASSSSKKETGLSSKAVNSQRNTGVISNSTADTISNSTADAISNSTADAIPNSTANAIPNSTAHTINIVNSSSKEAGRNSKNEKSVSSIETRKDAVSTPSEQNLNARREVISELESKIEMGSLGKELESRRASEASQPKLAPVDNTLSNFTITTYKKQTSLNIFEETGDETKPLATLPRNRNALDHVASKSVVDHFNGRKEDAVLNGNDSNRTELDTLKRDSQPNGEDRRDREKSVQRSKSHVSAINGERYKGTACENGEWEKEDASATKKPANEKFSQWRENILRRQEEPTKEKQLQSLQVLKSILPQLKNAQQAEENVSKECNDISLPEDNRYEATVSSEHSIESNVVPAHEPRRASRSDEGRKEPNPKRYTYTGPPAIVLGSWSERPSVNVQIKMDTDYKLSASNATGAKTVVNLNGLETHAVNGSSCARNGDFKPETVKQESIKREAIKQDAIKREAIKQEAIKEPDELTKKLITHTTATGFKRPTLNKVSKPETAEKSVEVERNGDEIKIDTSSVNFRDLARAFGEDVCLKAKPRRSSSNRHSDYFGRQEIERSQRAVNPTPNERPVANGVQGTGRFTSVVGIRASNPIAGAQTGNYAARNPAKIVSSMPVVKGFKIPTGPVPGNVAAEQNEKTAPIITGVTLKSASARPKSMPVHVDSRDILLESIRNFGGREKLRSATGRY